MAWVWELFIDIGRSTISVLFSHYILQTLLDPPSDQRQEDPKTTHFAAEVPAGKGSIEHITVSQWSKVNSGNIISALRLTNFIDLIRHSRRLQERVLDENLNQILRDMPSLDPAMWDERAALCSNDRVTSNETAYKEYSPIHLSAFKIGSMPLLFEAISTILVHVMIHHERLSHQNECISFLLGFYLSEDRRNGQLLCQFAYSGGDLVPQGD
ncbi:hypothetical protein RHSIM_Rhsim05G0023700 [Rhododendron simsii]|uniref:Uncharacterized protein n=1 Tax=Rhododendron simsii TaxID=118357 RepID=A0A834H2Q8_RHOSS|nr:hypothetical protein RHSIM_Rhsim05G0023700 [Rhododendron simsii]